MCFQRVGAAVQKALPTNDDNLCQQIVNRLASEYKCANWGVGMDEIRLVGGKTMECVECDEEYQSGKRQQTVIADLK